MVSLYYKKSIFLSGAVVLIFIAVYFFSTGWISDYYLRLGKKQMDDENYKSAIISLQRSLRYGNGNKDALAYAYLGRSVLGRFDGDGDVAYPGAEEDDYFKAIDYFKKSIDANLEKDYEQLYLQTLEYLGFSYLHVKQHDTGIEILLKKIEMDPLNSFWSRYLVAKTYYTVLNKPGEALNFLSPALESINIPQAGLSRAYLLLSRLYLYVGDTDNYKKYTLLAPAGAVRNIDVKDTAYQLAEMYWTNGEIDKAVAEINKIDSTENNCVLAKAYLFNKDYKKAIEFAKNGFAGNGSYSDARCLRVLGYAYKGFNNKAEAKRFFEEFLAASEKLDEKNIFLLRHVEDVKKELLSL